MTAPTTTTAGSIGLAGATHGILRIVAGALFCMHGMPKLFGWFGGMGEAGGPAPLVSLMGLAGSLEVFGGLLILLGLFTRPVAVILALEMIIAYFMSHLPRGLIPYLNGGELALLYMGVWIFLAGNGAGPWSLERRLPEGRRHGEEETRLVDPRKRVGDTERAGDRPL